MAKRRHLIVEGTATARAYTSTQTARTGAPFDHPARDRVPHARKLKSDIESAKQEAEERVAAAVEGITIKNLALECFSSEGDSLEVDRLDDRRSKIELLATRQEGGRTYATVFVPEDRLKNFLAKIDRYETENDARRRDGGPKNKELIESIDGIRLPIVRSFWTDADDRFPEHRGQAIWWEVWLRTGTDDPDQVFAQFVAEAARVDLRLSEQVVRFPERLVFLAFGSVTQWAGSLALLGDIAELRRAKEVPTDYVGLPPKEQAEFVEDGATRVEAPPADAPAVCILDTGLNAGHPLLRRAITEDDLQAVHPDWSVADEHSHGTQMAGIALFGDGLAEHLSGSGAQPLRIRLESVKILHPTIEHDPDNYGYVSTEALARAEASQPQRARAACLAVTSDDRDAGHPTLWSAAVDQHAAGANDDVRRLYVLAVGNIREFIAGQYEYPRSNQEDYGVEDPGHSWNALTVGAFTDAVHIRSEDFAGYQPVAPRGGLSPRSRTSMMWAGREWPFKPDIVMEGGNYARDPAGHIVDCDDLRMLTTTIEPTGRLLDTMADTSAAAAQASKLAAELMAHYPTLWPETIRGLMVHSAQWTDRMREEFPDDRRETIHRRLRCYGFGVPNADRAFWTVENRVSLISQATLRPFHKTTDGVKTKECHFHDFPWPKEVLESLGEVAVTVRITLSYFVEPSPGRRGPTSKFRYASHGLRFALRGPTESDADFLKRVSRESWSEEEREQGGQRPTTGDPQDRWEIGRDNRARGSIHHDSWTGTAAEVAACGQVAVFPVTGWWKERPHLGRYDRDARYSLIVTISTPEEDVDLYTPIAQRIGIAVST